MGCVLLDIDHFKSINDNHGHSTGDLVLKGIGATLMELVTAPGVLCRYGGEEFCILLPGHDIDQTAQVAEEYRRAVERLEFEDLKVTSSFGATAVSLGAENAQDLLDEADKCLYAAKRGGRNQVSRWDLVPRDMDFSEPVAREPAPLGQGSAAQEPAISSEAALRLGQTMDGLGQMIDRQDFVGLENLAAEVHTLAKEQNLSEVAAAARPVTRCCGDRGCG